MAAQLGTVFKIIKGGQVVAQCRAKSLKIGNEPVDITNDGSSGFRALANKFAGRAIDISLDGIADQSFDLRDHCTAHNTTGAINPVINSLRIESATWAIIGSFMAVSYEEQGSFDDAIKFSAELQSTGQWAYLDEI